MIDTASWFPKIFQLSNQIDIRAHEMLSYNQFKNIKMSFFASHMKQSFSALILINESWHKNGRDCKTAE